MKITKSRNYREGGYLGKRSLKAYGCGLRAGRHDFSLKSSKKILKLKLAFAGRWSVEDCCEYNKIWLKIHEQTRSQINRKNIK